MVVYESQARLSSKKSEFRMKEAQREVNRSHSIARLYSKIFAFYFRFNDCHEVSHRRNDIFTRLCHSIADECTLERVDSEKEQNEKGFLCLSSAHQIGKRDVIVTAGNRCEKRHSVPFSIYFCEHVFRAVSRIMNARLFLVFRCFWVTFVWLSSQAR